MRSPLASQQNPRQMLTFAAHIGLYMRLIITFLLVLMGAGRVLAQGSDSSFVVVGRVLVNGNKLTKERIILRELDLKTGDTLRLADVADRLEKERRKVFNTNLFLSVVVELERLPAQQANVLVNVREQWYIFPFPVFQLADRNFNEWWFERNRDLRRTIYGVNLRHRNVRGRAEELKVNLEFGFTQFTEIFYRIPYLDKAQKTGITLGASYSTNKIVRYRTDLDKLQDVRSDDRLRDRFYVNAILRRRNKFYDFQFLELRYARNRIADTLALLNPNYFLDGRTEQQFWQLSYRYLYDFRDKVQYPLRGHFLSVQADKFGLLPTDDLKQLALTLTYARYIPLGKRLFYNVGGKAKYSTPRRQPFLQYIGLGYQQDFVRGYELYAIDGHAYAYARNTLRWQAIDKTFNLKFLKINQFNSIPLAVYPNIFADAGYVWNAYPVLNNTRLANRALLGGGVGLDFVTWYNAVLRLSYTFNQQGEQGFRFNLAREF